MMCFFLICLQILMKLGVVVYKALDYKIPSEDNRIISPELEEVIGYMILDG